ncbi:MAG: flavin reductase family protein [Eubacteriales bacterium]|nr:flavin reductase family protein [Eubacteriales bacterium]MDD3880786.1 flavin reductase family protein [Eubacteriales bacterium]MDD4511847.1 flavin reductase family protein [Eubacteriales bacterium]
MKKNIGSRLALYPMPVTVIGAMNGDKPTWTLVAHVGIIGHDRVLVSLAAPHFINGVIKETKKLSVNLVTEDMLPEVDEAGFLSGAKADKSKLFAYTTGSAQTPIIECAPLTMECTVADVYESNGFESFICTIDNTFVEEKYLSDDGKIDYRVMKPVLFQFPSYEYLRTGDVIGKCLSFKKD